MKRPQVACVFLLSASRSGVDTAGMPSESLRTLLDAFPGIVWTTDADLRWTAIFGSDLGALGFVVDDIVGQEVEAFLGEDPMRGSAIDAHRRAVAGESAAYEIVFGGQLRQGYVQPLRLAASKPPFTMPDPPANVTVSVTVVEWVTEVPVPVTVSV